MIIDHAGYTVRSFAQGEAFCSAALAPLGIGIVMGGDRWAMYGRDGIPQLWIGECGNPPGPMHLAFAAQDRRQVDAFHQAALAAGGQDNGAPGIRDQYHPDYYAAFVRDPGGHNIEAVCHRPEP